MRRLVAIGMKNSLILLKIKFICRALALGNQERGRTNKMQHKYSSLFILEEKETHHLQELGNREKENQLC